MTDYSSMSPEELQAQRDVIIDEIQNYEGGLSALMADLAALTSLTPADQETPLVYQEERWAKIVQIQETAASYLPYLSQLNDALKQIDRLLR
jgi:hypothetical protein